MGTFRHAEAPDLPFILGLLQEFYAKQGHNYQIPFDRASTILTIGHVISRGVCLVGESSCAGATLSPFPFNHQAMVATVGFWYFRRPREIKIFEAMMEECRQAGATHFTAASHPPNHTIARHYQRFQLYPAELWSMKRL